MYDIENLTNLNKDRKPSKGNIVKIEDLIQNDECIKALELLEEISPSMESEVLKGALWVKNNLFSHIKEHKNLSPKSCALKELQLYFNQPKEIIEKEMMVEKPVNKSWNKLQPNPLSESDVNNFYIVTDSYIYELMAANHIIQTLYSFYILVQKIKTLNINTIIDYGAGAGTLCILFKKLGYNVIYADLKGKTFDYAKWRFKQRNLKIPLINLSREDINNLEFDCILSTEVIEHVVNPKNLVEKFSSVLKSKQILIVSESCEYTKDFSSHLEQNKKLGGDNFIRLLATNKLNQILSVPFIPQLIFQKE
jgi:2-polyprenyl-3-methyl-5-hydroxy-6-metoxy-1,4-benzoquinol methylase